MAEFFQLSAAERLDALNVAADKSGVLPHLLEKDLWVVWSLERCRAIQEKANAMLARPKQA